MGQNRKGHGNRGIVRVGSVLFGADRLVSQWVAQRIPGFIPSHTQRGLAVVDGRSFAAGVVFDHYNGVHVEAAIAADNHGRWASRETLHTLFAYPFLQLSCRAITVAVPSSNVASLGLSTGLGFEPEAIVRFAAHDGSSLVILKMLRENCRWVLSDGQKRGIGARGTGSISDSVE